MLSNVAVVRKEDKCTLISNCLHFLIHLTVSATQWSKHNTRIPRTFPQNPVKTVFNRHTFCVEKMSIFHTKGNVIPLG